LTGREKMPPAEDYSRMPEAQTRGKLIRSKLEAARWGNSRHSLNRQLSSTGGRVVVVGGKLFCERMHVLPERVREGLPGLDRLQGTLALVEKTAFTSEGMLRWLNRIRPAGEPPLSKAPVTVEKFPDDAEAMYRDHVKRWSGCQAFVVRASVPGGQGDCGGRRWTK
jgi:hypothetical protein